jgi:GNAT superfamily N-acetyltransferase
MTRAIAYALRPLEPSDAAAYNAFLRQGVLAHPDTLRISAADIDAAPFKTLDTSEGCTLAAVAADGDWLGVVTVERESGREKRRHIAWIYRMYVAASAAGRGVGRDLLAAAIARAEQLPGVTKLNLTVAAHNLRAVALYEAAGFVPFSREPDAFRDPEPRVELSMSRVL